MKKRIIFIILYIGIMTLSYGNEYTDQLLDESIEEFANKNYEAALEIINSVLVIEPENDTAIMYKKTIEDVILLDQENALIEQEQSSNSAAGQENSSTTKEDNKDESINYFPNEFISFSFHFGENTNGENYLEQRTKIILGLPILDIRFKSNLFNIDILNMSVDDMPFDEIFNLTDYDIDLSLGVRYKPFNSLDFNTGYLDFKAGGTSLNYDQNSFVPYIGFDSELFLLAPIANNFITNTLWIGGGGAIYNFDGKYINNYSAELKFGIRTKILNLGWFYNINNFDSLTDANSNNWGMILGFTF